MAGDLTFYGRRDNILVIRVNEGKREYARLDLTKPEIMASPYFYLQQNDVVYVEQTRKRIALITIQGKYLRYFIKKSFGLKARELSCCASVSGTKRSLICSGIEKFELFIF